MEKEQVYTYKRKTKIKRFIPLYIMLAPGIIYLVINNYIPIMGLFIAFKRINYSLGIFKSPWVGLANFEFLFKTSDAWLITRNTLLYNLVFIVLGTVMGVAVAILLNEIGSMKLKKLYQTSVLLPFLISMVVVSYLVFAILSNNSGFINKSILEPLGFEGISWYTQPQYWPVILTIVNLWKGFGYSCILYYATVIGIDTSYYEAAVVDGATKWQQIFHITLPSLKPTIITLTLMNVGRIFYSDFGLFYQVPMNSGPLMDVTNTIDTYVYRGLLQLNDVGRASAAGFYQSLVGFAVVLLANYVTGRIDKEQALF